MTISLAEAKAHCVVEHNLDDAYLSGLIQAATAATESYTRTIITKRPITRAFDNFRKMRLYAPLRSVTSITHIDDDGASQTVASGIYQVLGAWTAENQSKIAEIVLAYDQDWPDTREQREAVTVSYVAGYDQNEIPEDLRAALLLMIGHLYANREPIVIGTIVAKLSLSYEWLLAPFKNYNL
tara:strand:+ start:910 stop:1455 length:546 start_codon:yes stop_codon:yes gene_type:complete